MKVNGFGVGGLVAAHASYHLLIVVMVENIGCHYTSRVSIRTWNHKRVVMDGMW